MRNVIILGTGGCASEVTFYINDHNTKSGIEEQINILGYLDYESHLKEHYNKYNFKSPVLGDVDSYIPQPNEEILIAVSNIQFRKKVIQKLLDKNSKIGSFIHHSSIIPKNSHVGIGNIVYPFCIIEEYSFVGNFNLLTAYSYISHDCKVGNNNFFSIAGIAGNVTVGNNNFFGIRSSVIPGIKIGDNNIIQAGMIVDQNIQNDNTIYYRYKERVLAIPKVTTSSVRV